MKAGSAATGRRRDNWTVLRPADSAVIISGNLRGIKYLQSPADPASSRAAALSRLRNKAKAVAEVGCGTDN
jgi:hypothetical protein